MSNRTSEFPVMLNVGATFTFRFAGEFIRVQSLSVAGARPRITSSENDDFRLGLGQQIRFSKIPATLTIGNNTGVVLLTTLLMGDGAFSDPLVAGEVTANIAQTESGSSYRNNDAVTNAGLSFSGSHAAVGVAAQYSHIQLMNPAASGKIILVDQIDVAIGAISYAWIGHYNNQLLTDVMAGFSKKNSASTGVAHVRSEVWGTLLGAFFYRLSMLASDGRLYRPEYPVLLAAGQGLIVVPPLVNTGIGAAFDYREVSV